MYIGNYDSLWMGMGANQNTSVVKIKRDKRKQIYLKKKISYIEKPISKVKKYYSSIIMIIWTMIL